MEMEIINEKDLPKSYISQVLSLNIGQAIVIPKEERRRLLAALYYYRKRRKTHEEWRFKTKLMPKNKGMVYVLRIENKPKTEGL